MYRYSISARVISSVAHLKMNLDLVDNEQLIIFVQPVTRPTMVRIVKYPAVVNVKYKMDVIVILQVVCVWEVVNT